MTDNTSSRRRFLAAVLALAAGPGYAQQQGSLLQRSVFPVPAGRAPNGDILYPPLSYDGRYLAFFSKANNLIPGDVNSAGDVFVFDTRSRLIQKASVSSSGVPSNGTSTYASLSGTGRYVVFTSTASNLTIGPDNGARDVFVHDVITGELTLVSRNMSGRPATGESYNYFPASSADGRYIAFNSNASDLVVGTPPDTWNVYVFDRQSEQVSLVSKSSSGEPGNATSMHGVISGDGRYVAFHSRATNLVPDVQPAFSQVYLHDRATGMTTLVSRSAGGTPADARSERASISYDGNRISFSSDAKNLAPGTNDAENVYLYDQTGNWLRKVSVTTGGGEMQVAGVAPLDRKSVVAPNGDLVAFRSGGDNLSGSVNSNVDIYVHDVDRMVTERISSWPDGSQILGNSEHHALNWDGSVVAFSVLVPKAAQLPFNTLRLNQAGVSFGLADASEFSHLLIKRRDLGTIRFAIE